jgi:hypothetical protein
MTHTIQDLRPQVRDRFCISALAILFWVAVAGSNPRAYHFFLRYLGGFPALGGSQLNSLLLSPQLALNENVNPWLNPPIPSLPEPVSGVEISSLPSARSLLSAEGWSSPREIS